MPRSWHDWFAASSIDDPTKRALYKRIVAEKKPYFMRYIYPSLMKQYNDYQKNTNKSCLREFQMTVEELCALPFKDLTDRQRDFLKHYRARMPVGTGECVMNKICRRIEEAFDGFCGRIQEEGEFDYTFMKSGAEYSEEQYYAMKRLLDEYNSRVKSYIAYSRAENEDAAEKATNMDELRIEFLRRCAEVCSSEKAMCDILLDLCYRKNATKMFVWELCAGTIVNNLLERNGYTISYPAMCENGELTYRGSRYSIFSTCIGGEHEYRTE